MPWTALHEIEGEFDPTQQNRKTCGPLQRRRVSTDDGSSDDLA
jgi:hypothetical protein